MDRTVIELIVPAAVRTAERRTDATEAILFPAEADAIDNALPKRRAEFTAGRWCARQALIELGLPPTPVERGDHGAPRWPDGVVGSITHCDGFRAAAVAHDSEFAAIGIDAEPSVPLPDGVLELIARPEEHRLLDDLAADFPGVPWDRALFSAKESVYKAWFPGTGRWVAFTDVAVEIDQATAGFGARILVPGAGSAPPDLRGRLLLDAGLIMTAVVREP